MERRLIEQMAKRDAQEYAYAKTNYGKGAGTRRKLIKMKVDERRKNDIYCAAFDKELKKINYEKMANKVEAGKVVRETVGTVYKLYDRNRDIIGPIIRRIFG